MALFFHPLSWWASPVFSHRVAGYFYGDISIIPGQFIYTVFDFIFQKLRYQKILNQYHEQDSSPVFTRVSDGRISFIQHEKDRNTETQLLKYACILNGESIMTNQESTWQDLTADLFSLDSSRQFTSMLADNQSWRN